MSKQWIFVGLIIAEGQRARIVNDGDVPADGVLAREVVPRHGVADDDHSRMTDIARAEIAASEQWDP